MNVIFIMNDSLRRDHLSYYGNRWIQTPNLDRLAASSAIFDRAYIASYPTVPNRTDLYTGRYSFLYRGWQPLEPEDVILPEVIGENYHTSMLIFDTPPMGQDGYNFMRGYSGWEMVRGHHSDRWKTDPTIPTPLPAAPHKLKNLKRTFQYLRNKAHWRYEKDYIAPRTIEAAIEWLERNHTLDGFLLWVDTWDPHEVFDPPPHYLRLYDDPEYDGEEIIYPQYGRPTYMSEAELRHVWALYAGQVTMVDRWVGLLLDKVEQLGLLENTLIIHTTDHGHLFGEHDLEEKPGGMLGNLYEITTRIPLLVRHPAGLGAGKRISAIVQPPDLLPTTLEWLEVPVPDTVQGRSLWPLLRGETERLRDYAFSGRFPRLLAAPGRSGSADTAHTFNGWVGPSDVVEALTVTDERWSLLCSPRGRPSELYDLREDPEQRINLISRRLDVAARMQKVLIEFMERLGASQERIEPYRYPAEEMASPPEEAWQRMRPETPLYVTRDERAQLIAFSTAEEARACLSPGMEEQELETRTFSWLREKDPKALIHMHEQYYWAQDLG